MKRKNLAKFYKNIYKSSSRVSALPGKLLFPFRLPQFVIPLKSFLISGIILTVLLLGFYVFQITSVISMGFQLQGYQKLADKLLQESKTLEINSARINSLADVNQKVQELGFEKMSKVYYIQLLESSVVTVNNKIQ